MRIFGEEAAHLKRTENTKREESRTEQDDGSNHEGRSRRCHAVTSPVRMGNDAESSTVGTLTGM